MLCLWQPTFNHMRRSLDGFTSMTAPIRDSGSCDGQSQSLAGTEANDWNVRRGDQTR